MNIHARRYETAEEMLRKGQEIRKRLMQPANAWKAPLKLVDPVKPSRKKIYVAPLWTRADLEFDAHVFAFVDYQRSKCRNHMRKRCADFNITMEELVGPVRERVLVNIRHTIIWEIKTQVKPDASYPEVGRLFNIDHTSCLYAVRRVEKARQEGVDILAFRPRQRARVSKKAKLVIADIRREYEGGVSILQIGYNHGVTKETISGIVRDYGWRRKKP